MSNQQSEKAAAQQAPDYQYIGRRIIRPDGFDKVTGRANYGADLSLPGMIWGKMLRSPHAHARIISIDTSKAQTLTGVMAVVRYSDFPHVSSGSATNAEGASDILDMARNIMADDKVLYHGHAIIGVAATSESIAEQAIALIEVEYELLPAVMTLEQAMADNAAILHEDMFTQGLTQEIGEEASQPKLPSNIAEQTGLKVGDVALGFAEADVIVEREFTTPTVHQGYIEPHACTASYSPQGQSTLWCSTQGHFDVRSNTAKLLGLGLNQIKVTASEIGGGFGGKTTVYLEPVALLLSQHAGRPVKMVMDRDEVFKASGPAPASRCWVKIGAKKDGTITAMQAKLAYEAGAFKGSPARLGAMTMFTPYDVENLHVEWSDVVVNKPKSHAYRAPGAPQATFAAEMLVSELAAQLNIDPIDLRLHNAAQAGTKTIYGAKLKTVGLVECLQAAKDSEHYQAAVAKGQGRGIAAGFWFNIGGQSSVVINMNPDGTATIVEGSPDIGGSRASMQLMAAETLGIDFENFKPLVADTEQVAYNDGTGGSRTTFATGMAVIEAAKDIVQQMRQRAANKWSVDIERVVWQAGEALCTLSDDRLSAAQICAGAAKAGGQITGRGNINARGAGPSFAVHVCDVAVDVDTGKVDVSRYTAIQDAGKAIHPSYVEGQYQGGAVQGIGWALNEEYVYSADGLLQNPGFLDYRIPLASDLPMIDTVIVEVANPYHPFGVRGVGESGIVPPLAATASAVSAAIGLPVSDLPCSPPNVLALIQAGE